MKKSSAGHSHQGALSTGATLVDLGRPRYFPMSPLAVRTVHTAGLGATSYLELQTHFAALAPALRRIRIFVGFDDLETEQTIEATEWGLGLCGILRGDWWCFLFFPYCGESCEAGFILPQEGVCCWGLVVIRKAIPARHGYTHEWCHAKRIDFVHSHKEW